MREKAWVRMIANTSGELEREAKSRRFNAVEAFMVMTILLVDLWLFQYVFGILLKIEIATKFSNLVIGVMSVYVIASPFIHKDTSASWGLGNPVQLWGLVRDGHWLKRIVLTLVVAALTAVLAFMFYQHWYDASKFLFGFRPETAEKVKAAAGGKLAILLGGAVLSFIFATCVMRYDNFVPAFLTALKILAVLATLLYLFAFSLMGPKAFADFDGHKFAFGVFGYVFWGALQQLLFCSYFGTRFRKGFAPATDPRNLNKRRFWIAMLNGAFFGLIHINSWSLVLFTWLLGVFLSWVFMRDRNRNLIALGFVHGFLGSSVGWLFAHDKAGKAAVSMGVGPSHMKGFDPFTLAVVALLVFCMVAAMMSIPSDPPEGEA